MNYLVTVSFLGKEYCGWQVQKNGVSVCSVIQSAVETLIREKTDIIGCGRTDAGVNAYNYRFNFHTEKKLDGTFLKGLNALLPDDISALSLKTVNEDFHARYSACGKSYIYKIWNKPYKNVFFKDRCYSYSKELDIDKMITASKYLIGKHDFKAFAASGGSVSDTVREIYDIRITKNGGMIDFCVIGSGFLYKMVRSIVGVLFCVGKGVIAPEAVEDILLSGDRSRIGFTMPSEGLYFNRIYYTENELAKEMMRLD